jgi:hypothetical protein
MFINSGSFDNNDSTDQLSSLRDHPDVSGEQKSNESQKTNIDYNNSNLDIVEELYDQSPRRTRRSGSFWESNPVNNSPFKFAGLCMDEPVKIQAWLKLKGLSYLVTTTPRWNRNLWNTATIGKKIEMLNGYIYYLGDMSLDHALNSAMCRKCINKFRKYRAFADDQIAILQLEINNAQTRRR